MFCVAKRGTTVLCVCEQPTEVEHVLLASRLSRSVLLCVCARRGEGELAVDGGGVLCAGGQPMDASKSAVQGLHILKALAKLLPSCHTVVALVALVLPCAAPGGGGGGAAGNPVAQAPFCCSLLPA